MKKINIIVALILPIFTSCATYNVSNKYHFKESIIQSKKLHEDVWICEVNYKKLGNIKHARVHRQNHYFLDEDKPFKYEITCKESPILIKKGTKVIIEGYYFQQDWNWDAWYAIGEIKIPDKNQMVSFEYDINTFVTSEPCEKPNILMKLISTCKTVVTKMKKMPWEDVNDAEHREISRVNIYQD